MLRVAWHSSRSFLLASALYRRYCLAEERLARYYAYSRLSRIIFVNAQMPGVIFRSSFLGRFARIKEKSEVLEKSKFIIFIKETTQGVYAGTLSYLRGSSLARCFIDVKKGLLSAPLKSAGLMVIAAEAADITLSIIFKKGVTPAGWLARGVLLFLGFCALGCPAGWDELKGTSLFFKQRGLN